MKSEWSEGEGFFYHKAELKQTVILSMHFYKLRGGQKGGGKWGQGAVFLF